MTKVSLWHLCDALTRAGPEEGHAAVPKGEDRDGRSQGDKVA
jgi:hypothetical protein